MLHLHTRIDFDEVELARVNIHQELDGACTFIVHVGADLAAELTDRFALRFGQIGCWCPFYHFLVAPLDGAVALKQMIDRTMLVAENLHFNMVGAQDHLFEITFAIAKSGHSLAPSFENFLCQLIGIINSAHPAPAATPRGFEHQRITNLRCLLFDKIKIIAQHLCRWNNRNTCRHRHAPRTRLVSQRPHRLRLRADEHNASGIAGFYKIGILGEKSIPRMDRISTRLLGHTNNFWNAEISSNWRHTFANLIGLVRFKPVQRKFIFLGINRNRALAQLGCCPHHPNGDFTAIGNEYLPKVYHFFHQYYLSRTTFCRCTPRPSMPTNILSPGFK